MKSEKKFFNYILVVNQMERIVKVQNIDISEIIPYEKNPRVNNEAVDYVAKSINDFGWRQPIVVDENLVIIAGHTRLLAGKKLGLKEVPVHIAKDLPPEKVKALRLADNKVAEKSYWDMGLLQEEMSDLSEFGFNMKDFGFESFETKGAFDDTQDLQDTVFVDEEEPVNMFSASIKIEFDDPSDLEEARKILELDSKTKKIPWDKLREVIDDKFF